MNFVDLCVIMESKKEEPTMKAYRIVEIEHDGDKTYLLQKKSIFGFWYNSDNIDAYVTGYYDTLEGAKKSIRRKTSPRNKRVVYENPI